MNFAAFDLNLLRVFDALMRERSVTRAGEQIGLSQPAVSQALNRLRALLDDQLFVRTGAIMQPTPRAEALAAIIGDALATVEAALQGDEAFDPASTDRIYTLMGADFVSTLIMPELYARAAAEAPNIRLRLVDASRGEIGRMLLDGAIDLAIEAPEPVPDFVSRESLFLSPFAIVAARNHPLLGELPPEQGLTIDLVCALSHAIRTTDGSLSGYLDDALSEIGRERRIVLGLPHFAAVAQACSETDLLAALPRQFAEALAERLDLRIYEPPLPVGVPEIQMYWHSRHDRNPAHLWLRGLTRKVATRF